MGETRKAMRWLFVFLSSVIVGLTIYCSFLETQLNAVNTDFQISNSIGYAADSYEDVEMLAQQYKPTIVVFGADYCPTCVNYKPYISALNLEYGDRITIKYVDTVAHESIRYVYNIELIPSTLFYDAAGNPYVPSEKIVLEDVGEIVEERRYISDTIDVVHGDDLALNNVYEYGASKSGKLVYCKYEGLIDMLELKQIAEELLSTNMND